MKVSEIVKNITEIQDSNYVKFMNEDEIKLFNILLGAGEVKDLYVDTGRYLGGYYPLGSRGNEDFSGNGNDGTIKGSPTSVQNFSKINAIAFCLSSSAWPF